MNQPELFNPADTVPTACPVGHCQAVQLPGQTKVVTCQHDLQPADDRPYRRPRGCLNTINPETAPIPY